ncbi:MAG: hypothetical protein JNK94_00535 [Hyphomonadaceae bacterium]|nr:hypothetical protein [Hyphomonadaceae bacterium]
MNIAKFPWKGADSRGFSGTGRAVARLAVMVDRHFSLADYLSHPFIHAMMFCALVWTTTLIGIAALLD